MQDSDGGRLTMKQLKAREKLNAREQLHRMFPDVNEEVLYELLHATK